MRAVGYARSLPIEDEASLEDVALPASTEADLGPHDLLVDVAAVSVNPVDVKVRARMAPEAGHKVLGWDASGTVRAVGPEVTLFAPGDAVFYAGALDRPGTNAERHVVDERIVGRKPASLGHAQAAALPLTAITAWEILFDGMRVSQGAGEGETLLVVGGAGGVGSVLIQIARALTDLTVVATASRDETRDWCLRMGAHHVIDHRADMKAQLGAPGLVPRYVASLTATDQHWTALTELVAPRGTIALIDDPETLDVKLLKPKALTLHWAFMFTRSAFETPDMVEQHRLLSRVADLIDEGRIVSTMNRDGGMISAANLRRAHAHQESGKAVGKTVLAGFE
nr:zinc-binding alcohol dehydrogenase family protein [Jannaschia aquimarina]